MIIIDFLLNLAGVIAIVSLMLYLVPDIERELKKLRHKASGLLKIPKAMLWRDKNKTYLMLSKPIWYLVIGLLAVVFITLLLVVFLGFKNQYWSSLLTLRISTLESEIAELKQLIVINCKTSKS